MATSVYETETLELGDGVTVEMRPLKIAGLRKFMKEFGKMEAAQDDNDKSFDVLTACVLLSLKQWSPELANKVWVEDNLDINNYYEIIKAAAGIDMRAVGTGEAAGLVGKTPT